MMPILIKMYVWSAASFAIIPRCHPAFRLNSHSFMMRSLFFSALLVFLPLLSTNTFAMSVNSQVSRGADSGSAVQLPDDSFAVAGFMARRAPEPDGRGASSAAGHQHESVRERDSTAGSSMAGDQHD